MIRPCERLSRKCGKWRPELTTRAAPHHALDRIMGHKILVARPHASPAMELSPAFDKDTRTGDILWSIWVIGFEQAMHLRMNACERSFESVVEVPLEL